MNFSLLYMYLSLGNGMAYLDSWMEGIWEKMHETWSKEARNPYWKTLKEKKNKSRFRPNAKFRGQFQSKKNGNRRRFFRIWLTTGTNFTLRTFSKWNSLSMTLIASTRINKKMAKKRKKTNIGLHLKINKTKKKKINKTKKKKLWIWSLWM